MTAKRFLSVVANHLLIVIVKCLLIVIAKELISVVIRYYLSVVAESLVTIDPLLIVTAICRVIHHLTLTTKHLLSRMNHDEVLAGGGSLLEVVLDRSGDPSLNCVCAMAFHDMSEIIGC